MVPRVAIPATVYSNALAQVFPSAIFSAGVLGSGIKSDSGD